MLEASRISVTTGNTTRIKDISLTLRTGEVTALIGPNGAGKTTLLNTLAGSIHPSSGEVTLDGKKLASWEPLTLARKRAVLPQRSALNFAFPVIDVVAMGRTPHWPGRSQNQTDREIAGQALSATDSLHLRDKLYTRLSGGEQQRVQLARVLAQVWNASLDNPVYLLLDEPVSGLDLAHQFALMVFLREFAANGAAVLMVLHDLKLVQRYADMLWVLSGGKLLQEGKTANCMNAELIQEVFQVPPDAVLDNLE